MNKKPLTFLLLATLFLALSFIVYSWNEPVANMPSGYTAPLNTSATAQTKTGEIGASLFRDADNSNYYINPSGNSKISGIISSEAGPLESDQVTTKGYVDEQIALVRSIVTGAQTLVNGAHTWNECEAAGGTVVDSDVELKQCRFELPTCPSGWNQYNNFSEALFVAGTTCNVYYQYGSPYRVCGSCTIPSNKSWGNNAYTCILSGTSITGTWDTPCCTTYDCMSNACVSARTAVGCF
ncbi:MAG: hypothetical protein ACOX0B_03435 [Minisyncoccales bacterium]